MEVRIYEIESKSLQSLKNILEEKDKLDIEIKCEGCDKTEAKKIDADKLKGLLEEFEKKTCECGGKLKVETKNLVINRFARNGYILKGGKAVGGKEDFNYLYIKAEESFFEGNEKTILIDGVKKIEGEDFEKIKSEIEKEQDAAAEGIGGIFNI